MGMRRKAVPFEVLTVEEYRALERKTWSEKRFQAEVVKLAASLGYRHYHSHDSRMSPEGFPDLVLVRSASLGGRCIFAELKVKRNKLTRTQREWLGALRDAGSEAYEWRPEDWADIEQVLRR
jgi:hypothetical protein